MWSRLRKVHLLLPAHSASNRFSKSTGPSRVSVSTAGMMNLDSDHVLFDAHRRTLASALPRAASTPSSSKSRFRSFRAGHSWCSGTPYHRLALPRNVSAAPSDSPFSAGLPIQPWTARLVFREKPMLQSNKRKIKAYARFASSRRLGLNRTSSKASSIRARLQSCSGHQERRDAALQESYGC